MSGRQWQLERHGHALITVIWPDADTIARISAVSTSHQARRSPRHVSRLATGVVANGTDNSVDICVLRAAQKDLCIDTRCHSRRRSKRDKRIQVHLHISHCIVMTDQASDQRLRGVWLYGQVCTAFHINSTPIKLSHQYKLKPDHHCAQKVQNENHHPKTLRPAFAPTLSQTYH